MDRIQDKISAWKKDGLSLEGKPLPGAANDKIDVTIDQLFDIYNLGVESGNKLFSHLRTVLSENMAKTSDATVKLFELLNKSGINIDSALLKIISPFDFEVLCVIDELKYASPEFTKFYNEKHELEKSLKTDNFNCTFIMCSSGDLDFGLINSEGFALKHISFKGKSSEQGPR